MFYTYLFEAKSIQPYLFATNKLKEIIGGSELIEMLTSENGLINQTLKSLDLENEIKFSRCGGAAFYLFSENKTAIKKVSDIWPFVFRQYAPDLEFIHASSEGESASEAFENGHKLLLSDRNSPNTRLPQSGVYTLRSPRTGEPASKNIRTGSESTPVDQATARKLEFSLGESLVTRVKKNSAPEEWPVNLTPEKDQEEKNFPFKGDARLIGLIHADGNGFGQLLMNLKSSVKENKINDDEYLSVFADVSQSIKTATESAVENAVGNTLKKTGVKGLYPARPIVLGGDDMTMIVRADLALPFTESFLQEFEAQSKQELEKIREQYKNLENVFPEKLTACAGIVFAKSSQPFLLLHHLVENLCDYAKSISKLDENLIEGNIVPSSMSFYRTTTSLTDDFKTTILENELTFGKTCLTRGCYSIDPHHSIPHLSELLQLQSFLQESEISAGALRQITGLLQQSPQQAQRRYERWMEVLQERDRAEEKNNWKTFDDLRTALSERKDNSSNFDVEIKQSVPFEDVLSLIAVDNVLSNNKEPEL